MRELTQTSPPNYQSSVNRLLAAMGVTVISAASVAVAYFDPSKAGFFPVCPLFQMTGLACPGCGMTRGFHALFHGDIVAALDFNALLPLAASALGYCFVSLLMLTVAGRGL